MKIKTLLIFGVVLVLLCGSVGLAEDGKLIVTASRLNGRAEPKKSSYKEALFDRADQVVPTGNWSKDHKWVEVKGGENGTVWCDIRYLTERWDTFTACNDSRRTVKIRATPVGGKITGYLKAGKTIEITQVVLGWGKCSKGWIDLGYLVEVD